MAQQQVDISAMSLEQLNTYKGQFENEIKQLPVWKSTSAPGAPDNSSLSHFSAMTRPCRLR